MRRLPVRQPARQPLQYVMLHRGRRRRQGGGRRAAIPRRRRGGGRALQAGGGGERGLRLCLAAERLQRGAEAVVRLGVARVERDGAARLEQPALRVAEAAVHLCRSVSQRREHG